MTLDEKREAGNILTDLTMVAKEQSGPDSGYDVLTLVTNHSPLTTHYSPLTTPNFRRGDMVVLYAYQDIPDVRRSLLFRGRLTDISTDQITIKLNDAQQNPNVLDPPPSTLHLSPSYAVEPDTSDVGTTSAIRSLYALVTAPLHKRQLLLGRRVPQADTSIQLSRSYHPNYDDVLLRQKQARDYFLLVGPPGTGKTSMALRFMIEEELTASPSTLHLPPSSLNPSPSTLLMAYTNRAVDEICAMLVDAGIDFLRLGNEASCDPRFRGHLLDAMLGDTPRLDDMRRRIRETRVVVSTTATIQARPFIFQLKRFSLCVVDEASQILEPDVIGLWANDAIGRFVLIGDYKQLPAVVQQPGRHETLFERLIRWERQQGRKQFMGTLHHQGLMHP